MNRRRVAIVAAALATVIVVAWSVQRAYFNGTDEWITVMAEPFVRHIDASGELRSANSVNAGCPQIRHMWNFTVVRMAPEGKPVTKGTPVLQFDVQKLHERLQVKSSELETVRKELDKTRLDTQEKLEALVLENAEIKARRTRLDRKLDIPVELHKRFELEKLRLDERLTDRELELSAERIALQRENKTARIGAAEARVATLEREVQQLEEQIQKMTVVATRDGFVVHVTSWNGEKVKEGESVWSGRQILEIADLSNMEVTAEIAEPDAGYVQIGQRTETRLDAAPDRLFTGKIVRLGRLFRTKSRDAPSKVFDAIISIDEPDPDLMRPGMAVSVEVLAPTDEPVIRIPETAVRFDGDGPAVVARRANGESGEIPVILGQRWEGEVVIDSGLGEGDSVRLDDDR